MKAELFELLYQDVNDSELVKFRRDVMTRFIVCSIHNAEMDERDSKTKKDLQGNPAKYFGHVLAGKMCFGAQTDTQQTPQEKADEPKQDALPGTDTDWELIGLQKTRCALAAALIGSGTMVPFTEDIEAELDKYVGWVMKPK